MVIRKRLLFWLIKAYIKRLGKQIGIFFLVGLVIFFILLRLISWLLPKIPIGSNQKIGMIGTYYLENLPQMIMADISYGLTGVNEKGEIIPQLAQSWEILDNGKTYVFHLKDRVLFSDNTEVTSDKIGYQFTNVTVRYPTAYTVSYTLQDSYSPFLVTVSKPIFKKGFVGLGEYFVVNIDLNGDFVKSITLASRKNRYNTKTYYFYSSQEALKMAYVLGQVSRAVGLYDTTFLNTDLAHYNNTEVKKSINYQQYVTLFYNTEYKDLSDKKLRNALSHALPDIISYGQRSYSPYPSWFWLYTDLYNKYSDLEKSQKLLSEIGVSSEKPMHLELKTFPKYKKVAEELQSIWKTIGIAVKIVYVDSVPDTFQVFLGDFFLPKDPDQYSLWHSNQSANITGYKNLRIDKLLEDGRKIPDLEKRKELYTDFQKYLLDDSPASFFFFPYEYELIRK